MTKPDTEKQDAPKETAIETVVPETPPKAPPAESGGRDGADPTCLRWLGKKRPLGLIFRP